MLLVSTACSHRSCRTHWQFKACRTGRLAVSNFEAADRAVETIRALSDECMRFRLSFLHDYLIYSTLYGDDRIRNNGRMQFLSKYNTNILLPGDIVTSPTVACFKKRTCQTEFYIVVLFLICGLTLYFRSPVSAVLYCLGV